MQPLKIMCLTFTPAVIVWCAAYAAKAEFVPIRYQARRVSTAPLVDGDLRDPVWNQADPIRDFFAYKSGGAPPAAQTIARILWDESNLYLGFEMADSDIRTSCGLQRACGRDANLFLGDVIEFFVKESSDSPRYHEFEWSPLGEQFDARFDRVRFGAPGIRWDSGMRSSVQVQGSADDPTDADRVWTVEAVIPLSDFENAPIDFGTEWRFTVARYDYFNNPPNPQERLMMSTRGDPLAIDAGVTAGFHTYEIYDVLVFAEGIPEPSTLLLGGIGTFLLLYPHRQGAPCFLRSSKSSV